MRLQCGFTDVGETVRGRATGAKLPATHATTDFMLSNSTWFFAAFCAGLALLVCATAKPLCQALRLLDHPSERKRHREPTPLAGGLVILIAIVPLLTLAMLTGRMPLPRHVASIFISVVTAVTAIGLSDDRHGHSTMQSESCQRISLLNRIMSRMASIRR